MQYTTKRFKLLVMTVLLLLTSCRPIHGDDGLLPAIGIIAGLYGAVLIEALCLCSSLPSPEEVLKEAKEAEDTICEKHSIILEAHNQKSDDDFKNELCRACSDSTSLASLFVIAPDLQLLSKQITQLQQTKGATKDLALEQIAQLSEKEEILTKLHEDLLSVSKRFEVYKQYFELRKALELYKKKPIGCGIYPTVHLVQNIRLREEELGAIISQAQLFDYSDLVDDALAILYWLAEKREKLEQTELYLTEYKSYLEYESKMLLQTLHNTEFKQQAELDRQCKLQVVASEQNFKLTMAFVCCFGMAAIKHFM